MTTASERYYLPEGYTENPPRSLDDFDFGKPYWNEMRIRASHYYQDAIYTRAAALAKQNSLRSLLDVGCGCGVKLARLHARIPSLRIAGLDQEHAIRFCRDHHPFGAWFAADLEKALSIPLGDPFDLILCADVIEHLRHPDSVLELIRTYLAPNGFVLISTIDRDRLYRGLCRRPQNPEHIREWNLPEFQQLLQSRGFQILRSGHVFPTRIGWNSFFIRELIRQIRSYKTLRYVQVHLLQKTGISS